MPWGQRREDQESILTAVHDTVIGAVLHDAAPPRAAPGQPVDEVLAQSVYHQRRRHRGPQARRSLRVPGSLRGFGFAGDAARNDDLFWQGIQYRLGRAGALEQRSLLSQVIYRYAYDVCGNFNERVYGLARRGLPPLLGALLNASSPKRLLTNWLELAPLEGAVVVQGEREHVRRLHELGTVVLAPTHVSNLDSAIMAFAILQMGLPPFIYGAARDLFDNPLIGYFLHNLGAYTVDRNNEDPLYRRVLKEYATLTLEYGYNNLFFPGGVRSRSGALERHLKLGLAGTAMRAYVHNLQRQAPRPKLFVVPATLSYQLVLEAETLVDDFLKDVGKSRYIITDDEFSRPLRVYDFITQLFALDSKIYVTLGRGLDPFGNPVDDSGESLDPRGRRVDCSAYVRVGNSYACEPQRDAEYTRDLAQSMSETYSRDNVVQATHLTARAIFTLLRRQNPQADVLRLIRVGGTQEEGMALRDVYSETRRLLTAVRALAQKGLLRLSTLLTFGSAEDVVSDGLHHFNTYHRAPAAQRRGDRVLPRERGLLFFYHNRLEGYGLDAACGLTPALSADHRSLGALHGA
jgi:glycerol-3-phosphate O-acyltransferase